MFSSVVPISPVKNPCATHDEVPMGVSPTSGMPWRQLNSTTKGSNLVAHLTGFPCCSLVIILLCASRYRVPSQYLCESWSAVPFLVLSSSRVAKYTWWYYVVGPLRGYSENGNLAVSTCMPGRSIGFYTILQKMCTSDMWFSNKNNYIDGARHEIS